MPLIRFANNYSNTLAADVTSTTATTISVTSAAGLPALTGSAQGTGNALATPILVGSEVMYVTAISTNTLTVLRGQEGTTAATYTAGVAVNQIVSRDSLYFNPTPGAVSYSVPTGTQMYTPNGGFKYHFLTLGGSTGLTIAAPSNGAVPLEGGDELRFHFTITSTALSAQPTWSAAYDNSPTFSVNLNAGTRSSVSFASRGGTTNPVWRRIQ